MNKKLIFGNEYEIYDDGRVWSLKRNKFIKPFTNTKGYEMVSLYSLATGEKKKLVHRLVGIAFSENTEKKPQINHIDGNKTNNHISNLEWMTASENNQHAWDTGLRKRTLATPLPDKE